jgi:hypothetical protein
VTPHCFAPSSLGGHRGRAWGTQLAEQIGVASWRRHADGVCSDPGGPGAISPPLRARASSLRTQLLAADAARRQQPQLVIARGAPRRAHGSRGCGLHRVSSSMRTTRDGTHRGRRPDRSHLDQYACRVWPPEHAPCCPPDQRAGADEGASALRDGHHCPPETVTPPSWSPRSRSPILPRRQEIK